MRMKKIKYILSKLVSYLNEYLFQHVFQALIHDSENNVGKIAGLLEVDKKDLVEALVTRVIAASGEVV